MQCTYTGRQHAPHWAAFYSECIPFGGSCSQCSQAAKLLQVCCHALLCVCGWCAAVYTFVYATDAVLVQLCGCVGMCAIVWTVAEPSLDRH